MFSEKIFAERLKNLRMSHNLTLKQLGDELDATEATIGNYENCNKQPSMTMVIKIAKFFHVSIDYLIGLSDDPEPKWNKL